MGGTSVVPRVSEAFSGIFIICVRRGWFSRRETATLFMSLFIPNNSGGWEQWEGDGLADKCR